MPIDVSGLSNVNLSGWSEEDSQRVLAKFSGMPEVEVAAVRTALREVADAQEMGKAALANAATIVSLAKLFL